ncbi:hypothetical protein T10_13151 [Trichinella papuae]|uniref:Uncharacterized protein n=1 Tax=Trichinella papuae TaxID=268474 RepID=A0A0V1M619_9BILA|nr:hypothetical protein T10_3786 [Trichinella papuae]KRZ66702.1 hypothetical protein T10_13151 [Trichinella papuae]
MNHTEIIQDLLGINVEGAQSYSGYKLKKRFEVLQMGGKFRLIRKRKIESDISSIGRTGHGGERKTFLEMKKWANITCDFAAGFT